MGRRKILAVELFLNWPQKNFGGKAPYVWPPKNFCFIVIDILAVHRRAAGSTPPKGTPPPISSARAPFERFQFSIVRL